jgi:hypothetical protein
MGPDEMAEIGRLFGEVLVEKRPPEAVCQAVLALKGAFRSARLLLPAVVSARGSLVTTVIKMR